MKGKEFDWIIYKEQIELQVDAQRGRVSDGDYDEAGIILFKWGCIIIIMASTIIPKKGLRDFLHWRRQLGWRDIHKTQRG